GGGAVRICAGTAPAGAMPGACHQPDGGARRRFRKGRSRRVCHLAAGDRSHRPRLEGCVTVAVAIMAKAPLVGEVKTRLVPPLSAADAAELSAAFIQDVADNILLAAESEPIAGYVAFAGSEAVFHSLLPPTI